MNFNNALKNKYLYYAAVALMVINVLGYVSLGSIECVMALGGAAYLANHFTKNRTVDIFIGLFVSNVLFGCGRLKEGLDGSGLKGASESIKTSIDKVQKVGNDEKKKAAVSCPENHHRNEAGICVAIDTAAAHLKSAQKAIDNVPK